jgi:thiol-disulfide isomerase/thioredoxin
MKIQFVVLLVWGLSISCFGQKIDVINLNQLQSLTQAENDTVIVVNFWATWCAPCVKELPYFEALRSCSFAKPVKVLLISLDAPKNLKTKLVPFVKNKNLQWPVFLFNEPNPNHWINQINSDWSGAIPATQLISSRKSAFFEQSFTHDELINTITEFISTP